VTARELHAVTGSTVRLTGGTVPQAVTVTGIGFVPGGRTIFPPLALWALLLIAPLALLAVNLLAVWPGARAARLRTGQVLRTE
jgi:hypothetical protein